MTEPFILIHNYHESEEFAIYDAQDLDDVIPSGFNAVRVRLDGCPDVDLNWKKQCQAARRYVEQGYKIFWDLDLGLFDRLRFPLCDQTQHLTITLAIDHFKAECWETFREKTVGVCFYRGIVDFQKDLERYPDNKSNLADWLKDHQLHSCTNFLLSLFYRDIAVEYLAVLAARLPDGLQPYLLIEVSKQNELWQLARFIFRDPLEFFNIAITHNIFCPRPFKNKEEHQFIGRKLLSPKNDNPPTHGLCVPSSNHHHEHEFKEILSQLQNKNVPFKFIHESSLTTSWDGLDYIIVVSSTLSPTGIRMLKGFCAAGGTIISYGNALGLPNEHNMDGLKKDMFF